MKRQSFLLLLTAIFASLCFTPAQANTDLATIKKRMKERLPQIETLWKGGLTGENNKGFIEPRKALDSPQKKLIESENKDRLTIYTNIAQSTKSNPQKVGQQRAAQIAKRAAKNLWLQNSSGEWYKK